MKAVMISIKPKDVELIASGDKTIVVQKTRPKLDTPFKCYIYCTQGGDWLVSINGKVNKPNSATIDLTTNTTVHELNGKVIGEFVCDRIGKFMTISNSLASDYELWQSACLKKEEVLKYMGNTFTGYGWHISDLVIYDEPKELGEFFHYCGDDPKCDGCPAHYFSNTECGKEDYCCSIIDGCKPLTRPPQSWCYVEEKE